MTDISFFTHHGNLQTQNGYGVAAWNIVTNLQKLGHTVPFDSAEAPVQLNFCQPSYFADSLMNRPNQHKIGYTAWESTLVPEDWPDIFKECDEIWATSEWTALMYREQGIDCTKVYSHGIDPVWKPEKRKYESGPFRFIHHGEPAPRKGGQIAYDAFIAAFGKHNKDVTLAIKGAGHSTIRQKSATGSIIPIAKNVVLYNNMLEDNELVNLYYNHHAMIYPSYGEGFGFIPLQAMATGMPTVCTGKWADYKKYLGELSLDSTYAKSKWPNMHPGMMCEPDFDDLVDKYRHIYNTYDSMSDKFYRQSFQIHKEYDWKTLTKNAFKEVLPRFAKIGGF